MPSLLTALTTGVTAVCRDGMHALCALLIACFHCGRVGSQVADVLHGIISDLPVTLRLQARAAPTAHHVAEAQHFAAANTWREPAVYYSPAAYARLEAVYHAGLAALTDPVVTEARAALAKGEWLSVLGSQSVCCRPC